MIYPWLQSQWQQLLNQHHQKRLPQALLIEGPAGMGKKALAESLAELVLCEKLSDKACGQCRACVLHACGNHPDYYSVEPEEEAKAIKIEQIRHLTAELSQHSHQGGYQVVIINPAEKMNKAAANALLKTLEEPAGKVLIILVSHQSSALPATITSRCQRIICLGLDLPESKKWLEEQLNDKESADFLLRAASWAPLRALELSKINYVAVRDQLLAQLIGLKQNQVDLLKVSAEWSKLDMSIFLPSLQMIVMDLVRLSAHAEQNHLTNVDSLKTLLVLQSMGSVNQWLQLLESLQEATTLQAAANNINMQMLLESILVKYQGHVQ